MSRRQWWSPLSTWDHFSPKKAEIGWLKVILSSLRTTSMFMLMLFVVMNPTFCEDNLMSP